MLAEGLSSLLDHLVWPAVALLLGLAALIAFRGEIRRLLGRMQHAKLPGGTEASFVDPEGEPPRVLPGTPRPTRASSGRRRAISTGSVTTSGGLSPCCRAVAASRRLVEALLQIRHHAECLGFGQARMDRMLPTARGRRDEEEIFDRTISPGQSLRPAFETASDRLARMAEEIQDLSDKAWDSRRKDHYAAKIAEVRDLIAHLAVAHQPDFRAGP